jgi:4-amino-4-deoxy-L-arabinose transferase-like glycosyltransferase
MDGTSLGRRTCHWLVALAGRARTRVSLLHFWWSQVIFAAPGDRTRIHQHTGWSASVRTAGVLLLLLVAGLLYFGRLGAPLLQPEDAYYAEIPREMAVANHWVVPLYRGQPYYQKPPLFFWLIRVAYACFGVHDWTARLIPCVAAVGTILVTFLWGTKSVGLRAGLAAALILCLSPRFLHQGRMITMDGLLAFCTLSALALGQQAIQPGRLRWGCWLLSAVACGLGLLTKGPVALVLVAVPLLAYQILDPRTARPGGWIWSAYLATAIGLAAPWFVAMTWRDPAFLREFFWTHHVVMRFAQPLHPEPAWFYLPVLFLGMLPWTLLIPALIRLLLRRSAPARRQRPAELGFWLLCCLWCLVFYSVAACKRIGYIVPAMPTLALALGYTLDKQVPSQGFRAWRWRGRAFRTSPPYWATQGVLAVGLGVAIVAVAAGLVTPMQGAALGTLAVAGSVWCVYRRRRQTPAGSWIGCGVATFGLLLLAVHLILPGYYRKFSLRAQVRLTQNALSRAEVPVVCYPHEWDSIPFYLGRQDVQAYGPGERDRLIADLQRVPETLVFVKSGPALEDLLRCLPASVEFVPSSHGEIVTTGIVRPRGSAQTRRP